MADKEVITKWIGALRSGKYQQARSVLCNGSAFCCLGVGLEVAGVQRDTSNNYPTGEIDEDWDDTPIVLDTELNDHYRWVLGLDDQDHHQLIQMNDDQGATFEEIAGVIEQMMEAKGIL